MLIGAFAIRYEDRQFCRARLSHHCQSEGDCEVKFCHSLKGRLEDTLDPPGSIMCQSNISNIYIYIIDVDVDQTILVIMTKN